MFAALCNRPDPNLGSVVAGQLYSPSETWPITAMVVWTTRSDWPMDSCSSILSIKSESTNCNNPILVASALGNGRISLHLFDPSKSTSSSTDTSKLCHTILQVDAHARRITGLDWAQIDSSLPVESSEQTFAMSTGRTPVTMSKPKAWILASVSEDSILRVWRVGSRQDELKLRPHLLDKYPFEVRTCLF
ncbi:unnamed protein product [Protopolystoma xenopodis]|uniref:Uncharacterized protein n=1 Tax=Protopolystoma xenopodis TaxID=117903 RepID=A0A3S5CM21_9PLAT|nr:unnamed protein product [Protopolystoma xenopodis]